MLYYIYRDGRGVAPDQAKAESYLRQAVEVDYPPALNVIAKQRESNKKAQ
jgi:TPR repeat protein